MTVFRIQSADGNNIVSWDIDGKAYSFCASEKVIQVLELFGESGWLIVQERNVIIVDLSGNKRCTVPTPNVGITDRLEPNYAEYVGGKLHIVYGSSYRDFGVYVDPLSCQISGLHEAR